MGEVVLRGRRFDVERREVPARGGGTELRELVVHPGSVVLLPVLDDGRLVLIRNHRHVLGEVLWELPAGTRERGEEPRVCAARELEEETGYRARRLEPLLDFYLAPGVSDERMWAFRAEGLEPTAQRLDATEQIEVHPTAPEAVVEMIRRGEIVDAKTVATVLFHLLPRR